MGKPFEIGQTLERVANEYRVPSGVEQQQPVEQLEDVRTRLVNDDKDQLPAQGQLLQQVHDVLAVPAGKSTRRLIHKQHKWFTDEFEGDVQALPLASADGFVQNRPHAQIPDAPKPEPLQRRIHLLPQCVFVQIPKAQPRAVHQVVPNRELADQDVLLRNVPDEPIEFRAGIVHILPVQQHLPEGRADRTVEDVQKRRLPAATGSHDAHEPPFPFLQAHEPQGRSIRKCEEVSNVLHLKLHRDLLLGRQT